MARVFSLCYPIGPMRPLNSLTLEAVVNLLSDTFTLMPDQRLADRVDFSMHDTLMSGFAMMFFQHKSLLQFQRAMKHRRGRCNLETIFGVKEVPSDSQMRDVLDEAPSEPLRQLLPELFEGVRLTGWAKDFKTHLPSGKHKGDYYTMPLDGSEYFHSTKIECEGCLKKTDKSGQTNYYHTVVAATLVKAGSHTILPMDVEEVRNSDGTQKQDCEVKGAKRLIKRFRREHPQMKVIVGGDDLYSRTPFVGLLEQLRFHYVVVAKPDSHKEMFEWIEEIERMGGSQRGCWEQGPACKRRYFQYRIVRELPLSGERKIFVTFVEVWERNREGEQVYHNSWITDLDVDRENLSVIVAIGRSRWKIENEQFNVHKNGGYELEHNYGHGKKNLSMIFYLLNLLAYVTHIILDRGDRVYQTCRAGESRRELWNALRTAMRMVLVESWKQLLLAYLEDEPASP